MKPIQKIHMQNMKGNTLTRVLSGIDCFTGTNGAGKSSHLEAVQIALLGYAPVKGKKPADTLEFSSSLNSMSVGLEIDGFSFSRNFTRSVKLSKGVPDVKISQTLSISPSRGENNDTEKKARVAAEVGNFPVMLDFKEFLNLSDAKRRDFMYSLVGQGNTWDKKRVAEHLDDLLTNELEIRQPDTYLILQETISRSLEEYQDEMTIDEGLIAIIGYVTDQLSLWKSKARDTEGAIRVATEQKNELDQTDRNIKENEARLTELRGKLLDLSTKLAEDTQKKRIMDQRAERMQWLQDLIQQLKDQPPVSMDSLVAEIAMLEGQMDHTNDQGEYDALSIEKTAKQGELDALRQTINSLDAEGTKLTAEIASIQQTLDTIDQNKGVCVIQHQIKCDKDFSAYKADATQRIMERQTRCDELWQERVETCQLREQMVARIGEIEQLMSEIMRRTQQRQKENQERSNRVTALNKQINEINATEKKRLHDLDSAQKEYDSLFTAPPETIGDLTLMAELRAGYEQEIAELERVLPEQRKSRDLLQQSRRTIMDNMKAEYNQQAFEMVKQALGPKGIQGEIVKTMLDPLRDDIKGNLAALGIHRDVFFQTESDTGQEVFRFGWMNGDQRCHFDTLSTGQQLMFLIAFLVTVIDRANPPVKVLAVDNIENLDEQNLQSALMGLLSLKSRLDNILIAGVIDPKIARNAGWTVHEIPPRSALETTNVADAMTSQKESEDLEF